MAGQRKPPSKPVPLPPANGVSPPSGQVKFSVPLSVVNTMMVLSSRLLSLRYFITETNNVVELGHSGFLNPTSHSPSCAYSHTYPRGA